MTTCNLHPLENLVDTLDRGRVCLRCASESTPHWEPDPEVAEAIRTEAIRRRNREALKADGWT